MLAALETFHLSSEGRRGKVEGRPPVLRGEEREGGGTAPCPQRGGEGRWRDGPLSSEGRRGKVEGLSFHSAGG
ncbi:hypothetical protein CgunFtcFv8_016914 [Champsocephalus gunnari]|uniref:Uncharacterized protein n=1 Tax=Champsocephalus gunnari TaxID=52237 RepID=A0AAN8CRF9_CHAGU|nr:hypothetical protein CgunFtcFv8_016914 [Champsocephalus gunnari]